MLASLVPATAGYDEGYMTVNGCVVNCYASCTSTEGYAETSVALDAYYSYSSVYVGVTLYTLDWQDGSIDEYMSDSWDSSDYVDVSVTVNMSDRDRYEGYYASSVHTARIDGVAEDSGVHLMAYNEN